MPMPRKPRRLCACGCRRRVSRSNRSRFFSIACHQSTLPREVKQQRGREGGRARVVNFEHRLLEQLAGLPFREAVLRAYYLGRRAAYRAKERMKGRAA